jgi:hypothetical protein
MTKGGSTREAVRKRQQRVEGGSRREVADGGGGETANAQTESRAATSAKTVMFVSVTPLFFSSAMHCTCADTRSGEQRVGARGEREERSRGWDQIAGVGREWEAHHIG